MQFNIDTDFQPDVVYHEGNHEEDAALCGGPDASANDPAYTQYNGVNKYGAEATSHEGLRRSNQTSVDYSAETVKSLCEEKQTLDRRDNGVAFFDDYASVDPAEDKADTGSRIESPYGLGQITPADMPPRVVDKYATLLGRLAQADPRLAKYFMGIQSSGGTNAIAACAALKKDPSDGSKFIYSLFK